MIIIMFYLLCYDKPGNKCYLYTAESAGLRFLEIVCATHNTDIKYYGMRKYGIDLQYLKNP